MSIALYAWAPLLRPVAQAVPSTAALALCLPLQAQTLDHDAVLELPSMGAGEVVAAPRLGDDQVLDLPTMVVTGSHIRRADTEGVSSVLIVGEEEIQRSGASTVNELMKEVPYNNVGVRDETFTTGFAPSSAAIDLRGLGVNRTLVMVNGRRVPLFPFGGGEDGASSFVDINTIPLGAIDRVEILKDGASAIYGTDAIAGVVNMIQHQEYDGAALSLELGRTDKGDGGEVRVTGVGGSMGDSYNITASIDYLHREDVMAKDRSISHTAFRPYLDDRSASGNPGTLILNPGLQPDPRCPSASITPPGICRYDFGPEVTLIPGVDRIGATLSGDFAINEVLTAFINALYSHSESTRDLAPTPIPPQEGLVVGPDNPNNIVPGSPVLLAYRTLELGKRRDELDTDFYNLVAGVNGMLGSWRWELAGSFGEVYSAITGVKGYTTTELMQAAVDSGDLNPFGASPGFQASRYSVRTKRRGTSIQRMIDVKADGEVADLAAGPLQAAVGLEYRTEDYSDRSDELTQSGAIIGRGGQSSGGGREVTSTYLELLAPLHETMEVQVALRFDDYSDFGDTINPKLGIRWQPLGGLLFRASAGTGFKAPSLGELYTSVGEGAAGFAQVVDPTTGKILDVRVLAGGNPDLDAETSNNASVGVVWDLVEGLDLSMDGWWIENEDAITAADAQYFVDNEGAFPGTVIRDENGEIETVVKTYQNVAAQRAWGIDLETNLRWATDDVGDFHWRIIAAYLGGFDREPVEGAGFDHLAGRHGRPRWRGLSGLWWTRGEVDAGLIVNYIGSYERPSARAFPDISNEVSSNATFDTQLNWQPSALRGGKLTFGVKNLFDERPPEDVFLPDNIGWPWFNRDLYSARGRFFYARYSHDF